MSLSFANVQRACLAALTLAACAWCQTMKAPDIATHPTLYVVPYAHLDTQWRWEFPQTISQFLLKTMRVNFYLIDRYPHYVFNWTGANRYRLMKEYFPSDYARLKRYVAEGRWFPAGSSVEEGDVNLPGAEGIIRQILYGNAYFRKEFGKASDEYMLPDCFGFPASLPTILAASGVKGFSTQKLSAAWQPAPKVGGPDSPEHTPEGIPFNVGIWEGPDGETVIAALNPGDYGSQISTDLSKEPPPGSHEQDWVKRVDLDGRVTGVFADYHYIGTGDTGGAASESTVKMLEQIVTREDGPLTVVSSAADQMFHDITPAMTSRLPRFKGDLELINHSAGSLTSETYHKRWVQREQLLADAAERASVAAAWMGGRRYPLERLDDAWTLVMGGHFHDTAAGTATPRAYQFAWNDDIIALNQFAAVLKSATESIASGMDTQTAGASVVVYNPLNIAREDIVQAKVALPAGVKAVRVTDPDGQPVPSQLEGDEVVFVAKAPPVGFAVYGIEPAAEPMPSALHVSVTKPRMRWGSIVPTSAPAATLENARYSVKIDWQGDVSSIFDRQVNKELLSAPIRLEMSSDHPTYWPAWNMDFDQEQAAPRAYVHAMLGHIRMVEDGAARVAVEFTRECEGSRFTERVSLAAGKAGDRVEFRNSIDWRGLSANLKAAFPLTASNSNATYNLDIGTIERPNAMERQFEVSSHDWIDLTDRSGSYGATILTGGKLGSDKPNDNTIRLTLMRSPGVDTAYTDQANQDWGHHDLVFAIAGHRGDWRAGQTDWQAFGLRQPLMAFETAKHTGPLGKTFSLVTVSDPHIRVLALKKAEMSDEIVLRMVELDGEPAPDVRVKFAAPIRSAREVNGQELPVGPAHVVNGALETSFQPYQPRTFALTLAAPPAKLRPVESQPVTLDYDRAVASDDDTKTVGGFDDRGNAMPAEMLPASIDFSGVRFQLAPAATGRLNAVTAKGQKIQLPAGDFNRVYLLAASADGDRKAAFDAGGETAELTIENWGGFIGQWDTRLWKPAPADIPRDWAVSANHAKWDLSFDGSPYWSPRFPEDYLGLEPGFIRRADLAWYASHHHTADGLNEPYQYSYLFAYSMPIPKGAAALTLPNDPSIRILAISVAEENPAVHPAQPLYDVLPAPANAAGPDSD
jgi:alpha-mannosidase